jgi:calcineurin-like phosphoesterase family protein
MDYFTADLHFWHKNVIEYCNRPWQDVPSMNEGLINNWNEVVHAGDTVYILGDFSFGG